jgi:hypothetical protein
MRSLVDGLWSPQGLLKETCFVADISLLKNKKAVKFLTASAKMQALLFLVVPTQRQFDPAAEVKWQRRKTGYWIVMLTGQVFYG